MSMKKIFLSFSFLLFANVAWAQEIDFMEVVPNDPEVRVGTLENGAAYYIRHNAKDPQRANFHIVYHVGAVQEEDNQNGLAHFLEHMAFNGSKNFPGNSLIDYLQSIGVRFGENLNAGTGQEMTTYMITNVPVTRTGIIDSALLVLHDWAGFISLEEKDIDQERGVIIEEWRRGNDAQGRLNDKQFPVLFNNSIYSRRNVIGDPELIKNFGYDDLRSFYRKWYRPDLMAFIVVGDIDVDDVERRLKATMADIKPFEERAPRAVVTVDDNDRPLVSIETDPELTLTQVNLIFRHKPLDDKYNDRILAFKNDVIHSLISDMINMRLDEISKKENAPFLQTYGSYFSFVEPFDVFYLASTSRDGESMRAFEAIYTELLRMQRGGFTESELDRAKAAILRGAESAHENRNDRRNGQFINSYMSNFTNNTPFPTTEKNLELTALILATTSLAEVNAAAGVLVGDKNSEILISGPTKDDAPVPTNEELLAAIQTLQDSEIEIYVDEVSNEPLIDKEFAGSKVGKTGEGKFGTTVWTLGNGVEVVLKPTDFKADEIVLSAFQKGGKSTLTDLGEIYSIDLYPKFEEMAGIAGFSMTQLNKMLTGKIVWVSPQFTYNTQGFSGGCSPKDFETLMQLTYLYYVEPRFEQADYNVLMKRLEAQLANMPNNPDYILQDSLNRTLYGNDPRMAVLSLETLAQSSLEKMEKVYRRFYSNAYGMTFVLTGNFVPDSIRPVVEKYLGSLPSQPYEPAWEADKFPVYVEGEHENIFSTKQENPKVTVYRAYTGKTPYSIKRSVEVDAIRHVLDIRYVKSIREEAGGTYNVGVGGSMSVLPEPNFTFFVYFETDKDKMGELVPIVQKEIDDLCADGPSQENLDIAKEFFAKKFRENNITNGTWSNYIRSWYLFGNDNYTEYLDAVNSLSIESIRKAAAGMFSQDNIITVIQTPE